MTDYLIIILSLSIVLTSVFVVTATSPVVSVLYVVGLFIVSACYIILSGLPFVGLVYLVVYVGAVAVLFLFVVIILNVPLSVYNQNDKVRSVPLVGILLIVFIISFILLETNLNRIPLTSNPSIIFSAADITTTTINQAEVVSSELFSQNPLVLIIVGIVLLLAIIGPVSLSIDHDTKGLKEIQKESDS